MRRLVRRSMVLQVLRLRVVAVTDRLPRVGAPPERRCRPMPPLPRPASTEGLRISRDCVQRHRRRRGRARARTMVMLMPARFQVDDADYGHLREAVAQAGGSLAARRRDDTIRRRPGAARTAAASTAARAQTARCPARDVFFQQTVHLTPRGHEIVADALERFLRARRASSMTRWSSTPCISSGSSSSSTASTGFPPAVVAPAHRAQNWLLLVASYYFYAAWDYRFVALLAASTLVDYTLRPAARPADRPAPAAPA